MQLGHLDRLLLSCDGRIPGHIRDALRALDIAEARQAPKTTARVKANVVRLKPAGEIEAMAQALVRIRRRAGCATKRDLLRRGFTEGQIGEFGDRAVAYAGALWDAQASC